VPATEFRFTQAETENDKAVLSMGGGIDGISRCGGVDG